ncbi:MAG: FKBP-type peptidyl-prolyl cis-trans isomerase [Treponema sp.]|nr:FKBP-type peptidyl-prolyl cis-trans isomerase [Treponema sp.]
MKNILCAVFVFFGAAAFCAANGIAEEAARGNERADMSYSFGMVVASDIVGTGLEINYDAFIQGFREVMEKQKTRYTQDEAMAKIQAAYTAAQAEIGQRNLAAGTAFLADNAKRPAVVTTPSGLQYESVTEGTGAVPLPTDTVRVNYRGTTIDGKVFDSTYESGVPAEVPLNGVIPGWSEGLRMMKEGGKAKLYIPPNLAYGAKGAGTTIGPNSVLVFDVELLAIVQPPKADGTEAGPGGK